MASLLAFATRHFGLPTLVGSSFLAEPFGIWLKRMRLEKGLTQEELGERIGTKHSSIQRYESGQRQVQFDVMLQLADALPVSRAKATAVWVAANGGSLNQREDSEEAGDAEDAAALMEHIKDPDVAEMVKYYTRVPKEYRYPLKENVRNAGDIAREMQEGRTIGKRSDREDNPARRSDESSDQPE